MIVLAPDELSYVPLLEAEAGEHQVFITIVAKGRLAVSCRCLHPRPGRPRVIIEARDTFPGHEAVAAWRAWHEAEGITV